MIAKTLKLLLILGLLFVVGWLIYQSSAILVYLSIAGVVALIGSPIVTALDALTIRGRHLPNGLKAAVTLLVIFSVLGLLAWLFVPMIFEEAAVLTRFDPGQVENTLEPVIDWVNRSLSKINPDHTQFNASELIRSIFNRLDISLLPSLLNAVAGAFGNFLIGLFSVAFISFFFLSDRQMVPRVVMALTPKSQEPQARNIMRNTQKTLSRYFVGLLIQVIAVAIVVFIGLSIVGVENAILIAIFAGIINLVPYLGPWIGASFGAFILVTNNIDASFVELIRPKLFGMIIVFASAQLIDNYVFQPKIFSTSIHAHPLEIFLVILVAGTLGGVVGMIAAIPVYSFLRIVFFEMDREFGWLHKLKAK